MAGSPTIAAWIAHVAFWVLLVLGWSTSELGLKSGVVFLLLWIAGTFGLPHVPYGSGLFSSYVALLDIALVFKIVKGDVPVT